MKISIKKLKEQGYNFRVTKNTIIIETEYELNAQPIYNVLKTYGLSNITCSGMADEITADISDAMLVKAMRYCAPDEPVQPNEPTTSGEDLESA